MLVSKIVKINMNNKQHNLVYADYSEYLKNDKNKLFIVLNILVEIANVYIGEIKSFPVII